jgi:hypothetical protein
MKITKHRLLGLATAGLMLSPLFASSMTQAVDTTVQTVVAGSITAFTNTNPTNTSIDVSSASGVKQTINKDTVSISTNNATGYTLKLIDSDTSNALCVTPGGACTGIPSTAATSAAPAIMSSANQWGYHIDDGTTLWCSTATLCASGLGLPSTSAATSATLKFAKVPLSSGTADTIKTTATTASSDTTPVYYAVNVDPTQASGTYKDDVVYTATVNP